MKLDSVWASTLLLAPAVGPHCRRQEHRCAQLNDRARDVNAAITTLLLRAFLTLHLSPLPCSPVPLFLQQVLVRPNLYLSHALTAGSCKGEYATQVTHWLVQEEAAGRCLAAKSWHTVVRSASPHHCYMGVGTSYDLPLKSSSNRNNRRLPALPVTDRVADAMGWY